MIFNINGHNYTLCQDVIMQYAAEVEQHYNSILNDYISLALVFGFCVGVMFGMLMLKYLIKKKVIKCPSK